MPRDWQPLQYSAHTRASHVSFLRFAAVYYPRHMTVPHSCSLLQVMSGPRDRQVEIAWLPRSRASTYSMGTSAARMCVILVFTCCLQRSLLLWVHSDLFLRTTSGVLVHMVAMVVSPVETVAGHSPRGWGRMQVQKEGFNDACLFGISERLGTLRLTDPEICQIILLINNISHLACGGIWKVAVLYTSWNRPRARPSDSRPRDPLPLDSY